MAGTHWTKFFWSDWESDEGLRQCSLAAQGLWMRMLCICAKGEPHGHLAIAGQPLDANGVAKVAGVTTAEVESLMEELEHWGVFSRDRKGRIYSRRMVKDAQKSNEGRKHVRKRWGQPTEKQQQNRRPNRGANRDPTTHMPVASSQKGSGARAGARGDDYVYQGSIVRLKQKDWDAFAERYWAIPSMRAAIQRFETYHADSPPKKWFFALDGWLEKDHRRAVEDQRRRTGPLKRSEIAAG